MLNSNQIEKVLKERARLLRIDNSEKQDDDSYFWGLEFVLADEKYLIETAQISEVFFIDKLTPLPCTPDFILGIINIRGKIISVIELKQFLGLPVLGISNLNKVIVIENDDLEFGILADEIMGSVKVKQNDMKSATAFENAEAAGFVKGVTTQNQIVLDLERILESEKLIVDDKI